MEPISFNDLNADVNPTQAIEFLQFWFRPDDLVSIMQMRAEKSGFDNNLSDTATLEETLELLSNDGVMRDAVWTPDSGIEWNLYFGVCPQKYRPGSIFKRAKADNIAAIPGYWADLDVKAGGFETQQEAYEFLTALEYVPSIVVDSGNGVHAYWAFNRDSALLDTYGPEAWWTYLQAKAGDIEIDKLTDLTRVMKLPGSVAFAKEAGQPNKAVRMIYNSGVRYEERELRKFADPYYQDFLVSKREARDKEDKLFFAVESSSYSFDNDSIVARAFKAAFLEEKVNEYYSWEWLLPQFGWSKNKEQRDGSIEWTRPGEQGSARSAVTDWEGSNVMSLLSANPITRLYDLKENGVPITVFRAMLRLRFDDDVNLMLKTVIPELDEMGAWA